MVDALARAVEFEVAVARGSATHVLPSAGGFAVRNELYPASYQHNQLYVLESVDPTAVLTDAERLLGGLGHRQVTVLDEEAGLRLAPALTAAGFTHGRLLTMVADADPPPPEIAVERLTAEAVRPAKEANWRRALPDLTEDQVRQLVERGAATERACAVTRLGVRAGGEVASWCDLYRIGSTAQIEDVVTAPAWRNRGFAKAIVGEGMRIACGAGCDLVFLLADLDDWPQHLYRRLGFREIGRSHVFAKA